MLDTRCKKLGAMLMTHDRCFVLPVSLFEVLGSGSGFPPPPGSQTGPGSVRTVRVKSSGQSIQAHTEDTLVHVGVCALLLQLLSSLINLHLRSSPTFPCGVPDRAPFSLLIGDCGLVFTAVCPSADPTTAATCCFQLALPSS